MEAEKIRLRLRKHSKDKDPREKRELYEEMMRLAAGMNKFKENQATVKA